MQNTLERKRHYIQLITQAHSLYLPDSAIAVDAAKALERLPEQTLFYLSHLAPKTTSPAELVFSFTREDLINCAKEMGMPGEVITDEVLQLMKEALKSGMFKWGQLELKRSIKDAISWAVKSA